MRALKDIRQELGFSIQNCADILAISPSTYRGYELQPVKFTMAQAFILSKALGLHVTDIDWYHQSNN